MNYDGIKELIKQATDEGIVEFADFGDGVSNEWIKKAEDRVGLILPESYKWWLHNYGGGEICGNEIYSVYEEDFDSIVGGDVVHIYELNLHENNGITSDMLVICDDEEEVYYLDLSKMDENHECPVYAFYSKTLYAGSFLEFLEKYIKKSL